MGDALQIVIVTAAAGAAMVALIRPYLRRQTPTPGSPPCAKCALANAPAPPARTPGPRPIDTPSRTA